MHFSFSIRRLRPEELTSAFPKLQTEYEVAAIFFREKMLLLEAERGSLPLALNFRLLLAFYSAESFSMAITFPELRPGPESVGFSDLGCWAMGPHSLCRIDTQTMAVHF
jgi:hypothetical protein